MMDTLTEMGKIMSNYYMSSDARLYPLRRLKIFVPSVHHTLRKKKLTSKDRKKLIELYAQLNSNEVVDPYQKYYVNLWKRNLVEILNGEL